MKKHLFFIVLLIIACSPEVIEKPVPLDPVDEQVLIDDESEIPSSVIEEPNITPELATPQVVVVKVLRKSLVPNTLNIKRDTTVRWISEDDRNHLIIEDKGKWRQTGIRYPLAPSESAEKKFTEIGTHYILDANFGSRMTIIVE
jgi:plastocyanin